MTYDYTIKIRIYPNKEQRTFLSKCFGCCRFVYNNMIEERTKVYHLYNINSDINVKAVVNELGIHSI